MISSVTINHFSAKQTFFAAKFLAPKKDKILTFYASCIQDSLIDTYSVPKKDILSAILNEGSGVEQLDLRISGKFSTICGTFAGQC
jgi:hypothetical protein